MSLVQKIVKPLFFSSAICLFAPNLQAMDLATALGIAVANVPPGADVAGMGNAQTATPEFSTNNPAIVAIVKDFRIDVSATYGRINFNKGPDVDIYSGAVTGKLPVGVLQVTYSDARSRMEATDAGPDMKFNSTPTLSLLYGVRVASNMVTPGDNLYLGMSYTPISKLKLTFAVEGQDILVSNADGYSVGGGFLYKPTADWNIGGFYSYSRSNDQSQDLISGEVTESTSRTHQGRLGVGWQILPMTFVSADYQFLDIEGTKRDQLFIGVEQGIIKDFLYLYGGWADSGPTAGLGIYLNQGGINFAYMENPFDDLEPFLGKAEVYMVSAYVNF